MTVNIISIRLLDDKNFHKNFNFFVKILINSEEFYSPIWNNSAYLYDIQWAATANVPDDREYVNITIELFDNSFFEVNTKEQGYSANLIYNIKTGHWTGDDQIGDPSGYGRLNSYDSVGICRCENDYELWFNIYQNDFDGDGIPYWTEVYNYRTDPEHNNTGEDLDEDNLPIEWEHKWMYNPNIWDNHVQLDIDNDSLTNVEEYLISSWDSDPYRKDIFIEMDVMAEGPLGQNSSVSTNSKELLKSAFNRRDIVFHLDDGCMGGGEVIPFDLKIDSKDLPYIYKTYFLHNNSDSWQRSVFRYAMIVYNYYPASGIAFVGENPHFFWHVQGINTFVISAQSVQKTSKKLSKTLDFVFACMIMHETGHTFGIDFLFPIGCDNIRTTRPFSLAFWLFGNYKSCMNYRYVYSILDYSDGSHGLFDYNDWSNIDFSFFEKM